MKQTSGIFRVREHVGPTSAFAEPSARRIDYIGSFRPTNQCLRNIVSQLGAVNRIVWIQASFVVVYGYSD